MQNRMSGRILGSLVASTFLLLAAAATAGPLDTLQPGQWYEFPSSELSGVVPNPAPEGDPQDVIDGYSGGTWDSSRNRLIVWGGGHAGYAGNEVYVFSVPNGQWTRLTNPSASPDSVHTYDQLEYLPNQDTLFAPGGSQWGSGSAIQSTWLFGFGSNSWTNAGPMPSTVYDFWYYNMTTDYDPLSGKAVVIGLNQSGTFNPATKAWTLTGDGHGYDLGLTGALDTKRRRFVETGRGKVYAYSVDSSGSPGARQALTTSGPQAIVSCDAPGFVYDPVSDRFVGWCGGNSVYSLNMDTLQWTQHTGTNAVNPGDPYARTRPYHGTFGRFEYMPAYNAFIIVHSIYQNVYAFRLTSGTGTLPATPAVSISADQTTIASGGTATLTWSSQNVTSCTASGGWSGTKATSGSATVGPLAATSTYSLSCTGSNGTATNSATVTVQAATGGSTGGTTGGSTGGGTTGGTTGGSGGTTSTTAEADWQKRATGAGVVRALGFDTQAEWLSHVTDTSDCKAQYAPGCRANAWDQAVKASGAGSVRFDILSNSAEGSAGNVAVNFAEDYSVQFGANEEFWVQWRQRFDDFVISHDYQETSGSGEWKQIVLSQGDRRLADGSVLVGYSCNEFETVVGNAGARDYPNAYIECGRYMPLEDWLPGDKYTRQNQRVDASGNSTCISFPSGGNTSGCMWFVPNEWMTFMVHLKLGPQGRATSSVTNIDQPGFINSTYELYVAREGQPFQLTHRTEGMVIPRGQYWDAAKGVNPDNVNDPGYNNGWTAHDANPNAEYGKIWLTPYHTNKDPAETHQNASIWYDELIVSTQAIAVPGGTAPANTTPTVSLSASATTVTSGASPTLTWSSTNANACTASGGWSGTKATSGQQVVGPLTASATFTLACGTASRAVTITVQSGGTTGGGTGGSTGGTTTYNMLLDVPGGSSGLTLGGQSVTGVNRVYVMPETGITSVDYSIDGTFRHTEYFAPYELGGSTFDFSTLGAGAHTVTALVRTTAGQQLTVNASVQVAGGTGGTGGGGSGGGTTTNQGPVTPAIAIPGGMLPLGETAIDVSSPYSDPEGDSLNTSEWQIARDQTFTTMVLSRIVPGPSSSALQITTGVLEPSQVYWIRVRQRDARGATSAWSEAMSFTAAARMAGDADGNGVEDASQADGDANANGVNDASEGICDLLDAQSNSVVGLQSDSGNMQCYRAISAGETATQPPAGTNFPYGLFSFRISGLRVDTVSPARVTLRVYLPQKPSGAVKWYKFDPATGVLFELAGNVTFDGNTALVELVDGGLGDFDGVINGVIVDPSGPLQITASGGTGGGTTGGTGTSTGSSSGGGGSIGLFMPALMAVAGLARRRMARRKAA